MQDWIRRGTISKDKLPALWAYFGDVVGPAHWGLESLPSSVGEPSSKRKTEKSNVEPGPDIKGRERYPLISWVQAGEWSELCDNFQPGDADEWPVSPHNLGECGFFLRVKGHSMTAPPGSGYSFPEGVLLHVRPESDAVAGQFVIVRRTAEKAATFKRLALVDGELFLEAINPDWPKRYLPLKEGDVIVGLVVDASLGRLP